MLPTFCSHCPIHTTPPEHFSSHAAVTRLSVCPSGSRSWRWDATLRSHFTRVEHGAWWAQVRRVTGAHQLCVQIEETDFLFMKLHPESDSLANLFPQFEAEFWQKNSRKHYTFSFLFFFFLLWFSKSENYLGGILNDFKVKKRETSLISCNQLCHVQLQQALGVCVSCFPPYFTSSARESFPVQVLEHLSCRIWDMAAEGQAQKEKVGGRTKPKQLSQSTQ